MPYIFCTWPTFNVLFFFRYIHRFRNAPPSSRQARDHSYFQSGKGGEFWWLSPSPPTTLTPKEGTPPEGLLGPSPRPSLSPKLKRTVARRGASPVSVSKLCSLRLFTFLRTPIYGQCHRSQFWFPNKYYRIILLLTLSTLYFRKQEVLHHHPNLLLMV